MALPVSIICSLLFVLSACSYPAAQPKQQTKQTSQKEKTAAQTIAAFDEEQRSKSPNIPPMILPPVYQEVSVFGQETITLSTHNVKYATVLHTISKLTGLNLIIDSDVPADMPISISVHEADVKEVLNILMDITGTYYQLTGNILHIKQYMRKSFLIPYVRSSSTFNTDLGGDVLSSASQGGSSSGGGSSGNNGIQGNITLKFNNPAIKFYSDIEENIKKLLSKPTKQDIRKEEKDYSSDNQNEAVQNNDKTAAQKQNKGKGHSAVVRYKIVPKAGQYTLNKFTGVLTVYDKYKNVQAIEKFVNDLKKQVNRQVLIEAKILEVVLNKSHALGVNWDTAMYEIARAGDKLSLSQNLALSGAVAGTVKYTSDTFNAIINALDTAGDVDTLSNPRIRVLSGQSAIISSGKLVPFWEKEVQTNQGTGGSASTTEVTYNRRDVLQGLSMGVTPTIMEDGKIMLNIIPITSSIEDVIQHYDENGNVVASAPIMNIKEAGTIIYAHDNDMVLIGGLINKTKSKREHAVPWISDIPGLGALFKSVETKDEKRELVILIRLKVIDQ